jgi:trimeric autotransporter adhesin
MKATKCNLNLGSFALTRVMWAAYSLQTKPNQKEQNMKNRNSIFSTILVALGLLTLSRMAQAVTPAPDGGYAGGNTAEGTSALFSLTTGSFNIALGPFVGEDQTIGSGNIYIGNVVGFAAESNNCYIGSIFTRASENGTPVLVNQFGKLGTTTSSKRFKEDIKPMDKTSEVLFSLNPVAFRYRKAVDPTGTRQLGLVAEEVEKENPDLVVRDKEGKPYSVRYDQVNAMLLNEFLKEHRKVQELEATVAEHKKAMQVVMRQLEEQATDIQKIGSKIDLNKVEPRTVVSN